MIARVTGRLPLELAKAGPRAEPVWTLGSVRLPRAWLVLAALVAASGALILFADRHLSFVLDEWTYVDQSLDAASLRVLFGPHNEHWVTLHYAIFQLLLHTVGLRSYVPYLLTLLAFHAATGVLLFALLRRRCGDLLALSGAAVFLFLGQGAENIAWAFQFTFIGSVLCGLGALILLDAAQPSPGRLAAAALLLVAGLMFSGMGLVYLVAAGGMVLARRRLSAEAPVVVVPGIVYVVWFLAIGRTGLSASGDSHLLSAGTLVQLRTYAPRGLGTALAALVGLPGDCAYLALAVVPGLLAFGFARQRTISPPAVGAILAVLFQFALVGSVRARFGDLQASSPRYVYVAAPLLLIVAIEAMRRLRGPAGAVALVGLLTFSVGFNVNALMLFAADRAGVMAVATTDQRLATALADAPDLDRQAAMSSDLPMTVPRYLEAIRRYGAPVPAGTVDDVHDLPAQAVDDDLRALFAGSLRTVPAPADPPASCTVPGASDDGRTLELVVPEGKTMVVRALRPGPVQVSLWYAGSRPAEPTREFTADGPLAIRLPETGVPISWRVRVTAPNGLQSVCS